MHPDSVESLPPETESEFLSFCDPILVTVLILPLSIKVGHHILHSLISLSREREILTCFTQRFNCFYTFVYVHNLVLPRKLELKFKAIVDRSQENTAHCPIYMSISSIYYTQIFAIKCLILFSLFQKKKKKKEVTVPERQKEKKRTWHNVP